MKVNKCPVSLKIAYNSERHAKQSMDRINSTERKPPTHKELKTSYKCEHCGKWHLSSISKSVANAIQNNMAAQNNKVVTKKQQKEYIDNRLEYLKKKNKLK